jgi:hypothetical protein
MSKDPYPRSIDDYNDKQRVDEDNVPGAHGGPGSLPDPHGYNESDHWADDAKTWNPDYSEFR